jgi:malonyl-CoA O-methyltransferase
VTETPTGGKTAGATSPREAYRLLAPDYDERPNALVSLERRVMAPLFPPLGGLRVVDAGAGTGRWAAYCAARGSRSIALDFTFEMLLRGPRPAVVGDLCHLPLRDACADVTVCAFAFGYSPTSLRELRRITRPGGVLLMSDVHPDAIRRGWTRSFRHDAGVIEIAHEPYQIEDLTIAGLELSCLLEPRLGEPEREIFLRAGHIHRFEEACREPAIYVARWVRR